LRHYPFVRPVMRPAVRSHDQSCDPSVMWSDDCCATSPATLPLVVQLVVTSKDRSLWLYIRELIAKPLHSEISVCEGNTLSVCTTRDATADGIYILRLRERQKQQRLVLLAALMRHRQKAREATVKTWIPIIALYGNCGKSEAGTRARVTRRLHRVHENGA